MLRSLSELRRYSIAAQDGELGSVHDFLFDDQRWVVRYLVLDTGNWLPGRRVLISPVSFSQVDWPAQRMRLGLSRQEIRNSPDIDTDKPVSRQMETRLTQQFGWPVYWGAGGAAGPILTAPPAEPLLSEVPPSAGTVRPADLPAGDPHLRSSREVTGYHIDARDGEVGHIEDFLADDRDWTIRYLIVDTRNWWPGRKVLVAPAWVTGIDWERSRVSINLAPDAIRNGPEYDPRQPLSRAYERQLYAHYGQPPYWHGAEGPSPAGRGE